MLSGPHGNSHGSSHDGARGGHFHRRLRPSPVHVITRAPASNSPVREGVSFAEVVRNSPVSETLPFGLDHGWLTVKKKGSFNVACEIVPPLKRR